MALGVSKRSTGIPFNCDMAVFTSIFLYYVALKLSKDIILLCFEGPYFYYPRGNENRVRFLFVFVFFMNFTTMHAKMDILRLFGIKLAKMEALTLFDGKCHKN